MTANQSHTGSCCGMCARFIGMWGARTFFHCGNPQCECHHCECHKSQTEKQEIISFADSTLEDPTQVVILNRQPRSWEEARENLKEVVDKFPAQIVNALDAAYLHGLEESTEHAKKSERAAFGGCTKCYGKGYATVMLGEIGHGDFHPDEGWVDLPSVKMKFCSCNRGKQLESLINNQN